MHPRIECSACGLVEQPTKSWVWSPISSALGICLFIDLSHKAATTHGRKSVLCPCNSKLSVQHSLRGGGASQGPQQTVPPWSGEALTKGCKCKWEGSSQEALPFWVLTAASWILPWEKFHGAQWDMVGWVSESLFGLCANGIKEMPETLMKTRRPSQEGKRWPWTKSLWWLTVYVNCSMSQGTQIAFWVFIGRCSWMRWTYKSVNCSKQLALADRNGPLGTLCKVHHTLPVPNMSPASSLLIYIPALVGKPHYGIWNWTLNSYGWLYHLTFSLCPIKQHPKDCLYSRCLLSYHFHI